MTWGDVYSALNPGVDKSDTCEVEPERVFFDCEIDEAAENSLRSLMRDRYMVVVFARGSILGILPASDDRQLSATLLACDNNTNTSGYIACERDEEGGWTPLPRPRVVQIVKAAADQLRRESGGET